MGFSILLITKNEESNIGLCLKALSNLSDDVVVLDSGSTDKTIEIARNLGARVEEIEWLGYAGTKNSGHSYCRHDWILSIDADEFVSEELRQSLSDLEPKESTVYCLDRITHFSGKEVRYSGWYPDWKPRLYNKNSCKWIGEYVHEYLDVPEGFSSVKLEGKLDHHSYKTDQDHYDRMMKYAKLSAEKLFAKNKRPSWIKQRISPMARFIRTYLIKLGFLDGKTGWKIASRNYLMVAEKYRLLNQMYKQR